jgi:hypothetical protein
VFPGYSAEPIMAGGLTDCNQIKQNIYSAFFFVHSMFTITLCLKFLKA